MIVIGAAMFSRGFADTHGLGHPSCGPVSDKSWEQAVCDYKSLPRLGSVEYWDDQAKATYSYDAQRRILNSYDSVQSVREKARYVWQYGLKGIIVWESSADAPPDSDRSLLRAMAQTLANPSA